MRESMEIRRKTLGEKHGDFASSLACLGSLYQKKKEYSMALSFYKQALTIQEEAYGPTHMDVATTLLNTAGVHQLEKHYTLALPLYTRALVIFVELLGMQHAYVAVTFNDLAILYNNLSNWKQSEKLFESALNVMSSFLARITKVLHKCCSILPRAAAKIMTMLQHKNISKNLLLFLRQLWVTVMKKQSKQMRPSWGQRLLKTRNTMIWISC